MATFSLVEGTNNPVHPHDGGTNTEAGLAQAMVNSCMRLGKKGLTVTYTYDNVARTLVYSFSGSAA